MVKEKERWGGNPPGGHICDSTDAYVASCGSAFDLIKPRAVLAAVKPLRAVYAVAFGQSSLDRRCARRCTTLRSGRRNGAPTEPRN